MDDMEHKRHEREIRAYIDEVGPERYAIECMLAHMTDVECNRILADLPRLARECVERVIRDAH